MKDQMFIGYYGGFGGDLLATLVSMNFDKSITLTPRVDLGGFRNRYVSPAKFSDVGKNLSLFFDTISNLKTVEKNNFQQQCEKQYEHTISRVYDEDPNKLCRALEKHLRMFVMRGHYNILPIHYYKPPPSLYGMFSLDNVLPGSIKVRLVCEPRYVPLFAGLAIFKTNSYKHINDTNVVRLSQKMNLVVSDLSSQMPEFIDVDAGRLFIEGGRYIDGIEQLFSDLMQTKIDLKKGFVNYIYNSYNKEILFRLFGPSYLDNTFDQNLEWLRTCNAKRMKKVVLK